MIRLFMYL